MSADQGLEQSLRPILDFLNRHFNAHRFLWLLAVACFLIAWNRGLALLYGLLSLIIAVQALSWFLPWKAMRNVRVSRQVLGVAQAGKAARIEYAVRVPKSRYHLEISEASPCSFDKDEVSHFLPVVEQEAVFIGEVPCEMRGVFELDSVKVGCGWPFGFVSLRVTKDTEPTQLVVMPKTVDIKSLPMLRSNIPAPDGYHQTARPDIQTEFAGVREYRFGDSLKHIHWAASARHQTMIVREYESHDRPQFLVVINATPESDIGEAPFSSFEYAVMLAASFIEYAIEHRVGLHFYCASRSPLAFSVAPESRSSQYYLEQLAWLNSDGTLSYQDAVREALEMYGEMNTIVTIRNANEMPDLPLLSGGHLDIIIDDDSFIYPLRQYTDGWQNPTDSHQVLRVSRNSDFAEIFSL
jgi:uncharacterized protein (DUF58 family)